MSTLLSRDTILPFHSELTRVGNMSTAPPAVQRGIVKQVRIRHIQLPFLVNYIGLLISHKTQLIGISGCSSNNMKENGHMVPRVRTGDYNIIWQMLIQLLCTMSNVKILSSLTF